MGARDCNLLVNFSTFPYVRSQWHARTLAAAKQEQQIKSPSHLVLGMGLSENFSRDKKLFQG